MELNLKKTLQVFDKILPEYSWLGVLNHALKLKVDVSLKITESSFDS